MISAASVALVMLTAHAQTLPWEREMPLKEAAQSVWLESTLNATDPNGRSNISINNLRMHTVLWGPPNRITISLTKNDVWDRRLHEFQAPTLAEMTAGAFSPANEDYVGVKEADSSIFVPLDFSDVNSLARKLEEKSDPVSAYLASRLDDPGQAALAAYQTSASPAKRRALLAALSTNFNAIAAGKRLDDEKPFQSLQLRPETDSLRKTNPEGHELIWLNRLLLEDAYPQEISRKPGNSLRPLDLGWLRKEGGSHDPYRYPIRYAFPCLKPVGQIILGIDPLAGAAAPQVRQSCANGVTSLQITNGEGGARIEYVLEMTNDVYAIRGKFAGIKTPVWLRLYRHSDTSHLGYLSADGHYTNPAAEKDKAFNGPIDPPTSGTNGRYFWIRQKMPAEKTFPNGFEYVLMGVMATPGEVQLQSAEGKTGLGTPPPNPPLPWDWFGAPRPSIADAPGAAATATFTPGPKEEFEAFVTVVTSMDAADLIAAAKGRLAAAESDGFDGAVQKNTRWWNAFYDQRENGRVFRGNTGRAASDDIHEIYHSWTDSHGGGTKTDMRQLECSASYVLPERDFQEFDSAPCYNEIFTTSQFVRNRADNQDMWKQIVEHWLPGGQENARDTFDLPGMLITHGYLPPIKPDKYVHTAMSLELCLGTMAQIIRPAWDEWDYAGDTNVLRDETYPLMKQMALFYAAYAKRGTDGRYHVIPSMEEERWGIYPQFARNKDVISSVCLFRWALNRAAEGANALGVDAELADHWRDVARQIVPDPTWQTEGGAIFAGMPGVEPRHLPRDHFGDAAAYPTLLADEINLDSPAEQKDMMIRSVRVLPSGSTAQTLMLLGVKPEPTTNRQRRSEDDAETLLNSRGGRIHLFPAAAPTDEVAFRNFQARGGFLVSAARNAGGVYFLQIAARRTIPCDLMNPWPGHPAIVHEKGKTEPVPSQLEKSNGECIEFSATAGRTYSIEPGLR